MTLGDAGYLALLRRIERENPDKPPIGRSERLSEEAVRLGQDPDLGFPATELAAARRPRGSVPELRLRFIGFYGANGALPLNTTEEVSRWFAHGEDAFVRFTDIFAERFYQLFFRAWSDSHAISQFDHPQSDRFSRYLAAVSGTGTPALGGPDGRGSGLSLVSVFGGRVRSPIRLQQMLASYFGIEVQVEEHVPSWLEFEPSDLTALGRNAGRLGQNAYLGARVRSVGEKLRLHLHLRDLEQYRCFLPGGVGYAQVAEIVHWYLGRTCDVDLALSLPRAAVVPAQLGVAAELGWMAALPEPNQGQDQSEFVQASCFALVWDDGAPCQAQTDSN